MVNLAEMNRTRRAAARIAEEIERAAINATRITTVPDGMPHGRRSQSKVENGAVSLVMLKTEYSETLAILEQMKTELDVMISSVDDADRRAVLRLRFIYGYKPEQIAEGIGTCVRTVFRLMKEGKEELLHRFPDQVTDE